MLTLGSGVFQSSFSFLTDATDDSVPSTGPQLDSSDIELDQIRRVAQDLQAKTYLGLVELLEVLP